MSKYVRLLAALAAILCAPAFAYIDPPELQPPNPIAGQQVAVALTLGYCDAVLDTPADTDVTIVGQSITLLIDGVRQTDPIFCFFPPATTHVFPIGSFDPSDYTLDVLMRHDPFGLPVQIDNIGTIEFSVAGAPTPAQPVPGVSGFGVTGLIVGLLLLAYRQRRLFAGLCIIPLAIGFAPTASAQPTIDIPRLYILLSADGEAPSPQQIVEEWDLQSPAPTAGLSHGTPIRTWYLLPFRAEGDFKDRLDRSPDAPRALLERYIVVQYPSIEARSQGKRALESDPNIDQVVEPMSMAFSAAELTDFTIVQSGGPAANYGWDAFNMEEAWKLAGGYGLVGIADSGLSTNHPELRSFTSGGSFTRGNFLPAYSADVGRMPSPVEYNVDEREPEQVPGACPTDPNGYAPLDYVGHGTHASGLIAANAYDGNDVDGTCKNCGIAMWRIAFGTCFPGVGIYAAINDNASIAALTLMSDIGVQVINQSFGYFPHDANLCTKVPKYPHCIAIDYSHTRQVALVGASGNDRTEIQFPARDSRVVAVGGFDDQFLLWNEDRDPPPGNADDCPWPNSNAECGSNFTQSTAISKQELSAAARAVHGLVYAGLSWNPNLVCGDPFGPGPSNDGYGDCTGTSMSAPQVSGLIGLLRSTNPLVTVGNPDIPSPVGIRNVLATTTFEAQLSQPWNAQMGYGVPDGAAAARKMLGKVAGVTARNRATPLFGFYATGSKDYSYTTTPQTSIAYLINSAANAVPSGAAVPGYAAFPADPLLGPGDTPKASAFVLTTEYKTKASHPDLVPLYLMERSRRYPAGCTLGAPGCNGNNRDFLMATGQPEIEALYAAGYTYRGVNGYVYQRCTPEPACVPEGAQKLWRKCKTADDDCAVFLESQRTTFEGNGYTAAVPSGYSMHIGYAYPNTDSDGDGLVNGMELVIGTSPTLADTDGDGFSDGSELPLAAVSARDPCSGPMAYRCPADIIFADGFQ